ncbi:MAG TPA: hypothetical protein V6C65_19545 [Allocoleopsis sp.]
MTTNLRDFYTKQLAEIDERLAAVESDLESNSDSEKRLTLTKRAEVLLKEREEIEAKLVELDSRSLDKNVRDRGLEKTFQKIDFVKARETANLIGDKLNRDGGSVLFLLQKSKKQMGQLCIEEVINVIMSDLMIGGQIIGAHRRYSVDLGSAISQYNETEFLIRLASYFNIEESSNLEKISQQIREVIRSSIDNGTTVFLEIKSLDDLLEREEFLSWFIEKFWKPLIDEISDVSRKFKSKFIVALIADSHIFPDCPPGYFCDSETFDCYRMLELPLPNWTFEDVYYWMIRFRHLSVQMKDKENRELEQIAKKILRDSEGTPESICVSLRGMFV